MRFGPNTTLQQAKDWLRRRIDDGEHCPLCTQYAKVYKRKINSTMARALITLYRHDERPAFTHGPSLPGDTHEISQLAWWGLIEEERVKRPDGGRAGFWRLTDLGEEFVTGQTTVQKYARIYDSRCLGFEGDLVDIKAAVGDKFNYDELMGR